MSKLFIIGNGFDKSHSLPTGYGDFRDYLMASGKGRGFIDCLNHIGLSERKLWSDFEKELGKMTSTTVADEAVEMRYNRQKEIDYEETYWDWIADHVIDQRLKGLEDLEFYVQDWINGVDVESVSKDYRFHEIFFGENHHHKDSSVFINFNYTQTLQRIYNISDTKIMHIHGDISDPVLGHGKLKKDKILVGSNDNRIDEFISLIEKRLEAFFDFTSKNTEQYSREMVGYLRKHEPIKEVHVIGHALGKVDHIYFNKIKKLYPDVKWFITYIRDKPKVEEQVQKLDLNNYKIVEIEDYKNIRF